MANDPKKPAPPAPTDAPSAPVDTLSFDEKVALAVAKTMAAQMPAMTVEIAKAMGTAMMAAEAAKNQTAHDVQTKAIKAKLAKEEKCSCCRQVVGDGKRTGCGGPWQRDPKTNQFVMKPMLNPDGTQVVDGEGKPVNVRIEDFHQFHVKMVVFPKDPLAAEWFDGVTINGARYKSEGPGHEVWVPRNADIESTVSEYTKNEVEQRIGRKHNRAYGGRISGGPGGIQQVPIGAGFN